VAHHPPAKALSKETIRGYLFTARIWAARLVDQGYDLEPADITPTHIEDFIADFIDATGAANAAYNYRDLRVFWAWLVKREKITTGNPMDATEPPSTPKKLTPIFTDNDQAQLLEPCVGRDFLAVRDRHGSCCSGIPVPASPRSATWTLMKSSRALAKPGSSARAVGSDGQRHRTGPDSPRLPGRIGDRARPPFPPQLRP
jgi:Phage integrase, N-terminal SAM-like domain